jgi:mRNA interferase MazF
MNLTRGDIVNIDLNPVKSNETGKIRPCVIISNDVQNRYSPVIIIAIITEWNEKKDKIPVCVSIEPTTIIGITKKSIIDCGQIRTVSKKRIKGDVIGNISFKSITKMNKALKISLDLLL